MLKMSSLPTIIARLDISPIRREYETVHSIDHRSSAIVLIHLLDELFCRLGTSNLALLVTVKMVFVARVCRVRERASLES